MFAVQNGAKHNGGPPPRQSGLTGRSTAFKIDLAQ